VSRQRGSGLLSTAFGLAMVVGVLGLCVNVSLGLWERSTTDAVAHDVARWVAEAPAGSDRAIVERRALARGADALGQRRHDVRMEFERDPGDPDRVVLRVRSPGVRLLPRMIGDRVVVGSLDRRIVMRREAP